jgi:hypothetical protein
MTDIRVGDVGSALVSEFAAIVAAESAGSSTGS